MKAPTPATCTDGRRAGFQTNMPDPVRQRQQHHRRWTLAPARPFRPASFSLPCRISLLAFGPPEQRKQHRPGAVCICGRAPKALPCLEIYLLRFEGCWTSWSKRTRGARGDGRHGLNGAQSDAVCRGDARPAVCVKWVGAQGVAGGGDAAMAYALELRLSNVCPPVGVGSSLSDMCNKDRVARLNVPG